MYIYIHFLVSEIRDEHGEYHGLWPDILHAVCEHAHKKCHWVLDRGDHCWTQDEHFDHYEYPGVGKYNKTWCLRHPQHLTKI